MLKVASCVASALMVGLLSIGSAFAASPSPTPTYNWSGWYAGGSLGWGWRSTTDYPPTSYYQGLGGTFPSGYGSAAGGTRNNGLVGSVGFGYNYQFQNNIVFGVDYEFMYANLANSPQYINTALTKGTNTAYNVFNFDPTDGDSNKWYGILKAKLGIAVFDRFLPYVTGGPAYRLSYSTSDPTVVTYTATTTGGSGGVDPYGNPLPGSTGTTTTTSTYKTYTGINKANAWGWVLGAGVDYALNDSLFVKFEYLHLDFGHDTYLDPVASALTGGIVTRAYRRSAEIVRVGMDYRFNWGSGGRGSSY
jgi:outer membrane immunogenic protein